ncbi:MAG: hypothetical protein EOO90_25910 [Pedobacter sp.]|nr:MAG: hypothetical protein EOO90_25910 [Pedobacter sp.]
MDLDEKTKVHDSEIKAESLQNELEADTIKAYLINLTKTLYHIREDLNFVKNRYITPTKNTRSKMTKDERKAIIKHKLMTKGRKLI